jgi:transposase
MRNSQHTREFRDSAIQLVLNSNEEIKTIAEDLGVNAKTLYNWVYTHKKDNNLQAYQRSSMTKISTKESLEEELRRLRKENRLLKQERDILKKATAYFAKETL